MRKVIIESPLKGDYEANRRYARLCMRDSILKGEAPFASHLLYDQEGLLDDTNTSERMMGIEAGLVWGFCADATVVYTDRGISDGMKTGIARAESEGRPVEYRTLDNYKEDDQENELKSLRLQRFIEMGKLPLDYGILNIIISPEKHIAMHSDSMALYEIFGAIEFIRIRVTKSITDMEECDMHDHHADDPDESKPS